MSNLKVMASHNNNMLSDLDDIEDEFLRALHSNSSNKMVTDLDDPPAPPQDANDAKLARKSAPSASSSKMVTDLDDLDDMFGQDFTNDEYIRQIKQLIDEEAQMNADLDEMLVSNMKAPVPQPPQLTSVDSSKGKVMFFEASDSGSSQSSRRSSIKRSPPVNKNARPPQRRFSQRSADFSPVIAEIENTRLKPKGLPPVKAVIRGPPLDLDFEQPEFTTFGKSPLLSQIQQRASVMEQSDDDEPNSVVQRPQPAKLAAVSHTGSYEKPTLVEQQMFLPQQNNVTQHNVGHNVGQLEQQLRYTEARRDSAQQKLKLKADELETLQRSFQEIVNEKQILESRIVTSNIDSNKAVIEKETLESQLNAAFKELHALKIDHGKTKEEVDKLTNEKQMLLLENESLTKQIQTLRTELQMKSQQITSNQDATLELGRYIERINEFERKIASHERDMKSLREKLIASNDELESKKLQLLNVESQLRKERNETERLRRELADVNDKLFIAQELLDRKSKELTHENSRYNQNLAESIRDVRDIVLRLDEKTATISANVARGNETTRQALTAAVIENATKQLDSRLDTVFEDMRQLLREMTSQLDSIRELLHKNQEADKVAGNGVKSPPPAVNVSPAHTTVESKISELKMCIEKLDASMQNQELQLILGQHPVQRTPLLSEANAFLFSNYLTQLAPNPRPKSMFVQTLLQLQTAPRNGPYRNQNIMNRSYSNFHTTKSHLQQQINDLKNELGILTPRFADSLDADH